MWLKEVLLHKRSVKMDEYFGMFLSIVLLKLANPVMHKAWSITKECVVTRLNLA